jgi:hypothetical protein
MMFGHPCKDCRALLAEMRSAIAEANALVEEAGALTHTSAPSEHINGWWQTKDRWQSAHRRWMLASGELKKPSCDAPEHPIFSQERRQVSLNGGRHCHTCDN